MVRAVSAKKRPFFLNPLRLFGRKKHDTRTESEILLDKVELSLDEVATPSRKFSDLTLLLVAGTAVCSASIPVGVAGLAVHLAAKGVDRLREDRRIDQATRRPHRTQFASLERLARTTPKKEWAKVEVAIEESLQDRMLEANSGAGYWQACADALMIAGGVAMAACLGPMSLPFGLMAASDFIRGGSRDLDQSSLNYQIAKDGIKAWSEPQA